MNIDQCGCADCSNSELRATQKRTASQISQRKDENNSSEDEEETKSMSSTAVKFFKTSLSTRKRQYLTNIDQKESGSINPGSPTKSNSNMRSKRCLNKKIPKDSITCENFMEKFQEIIRSKSNQDAYQTSQRVIRLIHLSFPVDVNILGQSFLLSKKPQRKHWEEKFLRLDFEGLTAIFEKLIGLNFEDVLNRFEERIKQIIKHIVSSKKRYLKNSPKCIRIMIMILLSPAMEKLCGKENNLEDLDSLCNIFSTVRPLTSERLVRIISKIPKGNFCGLLNNLQQNISTWCILKKENPPLEPLRSVFSLMDIVHKANQKTNLVAKSMFNNASVCELFEFFYNEDNIIKKSNILSDFKWILDVQTKTHLLKLENQKVQSVYAKSRSYQNGSDLFSQNSQPGLSNNSSQSRATRSGNSGGRSSQRNQNRRPLQMIGPNVERLNWSDSSEDERNNLLESESSFHSGNDDNHEINEIPPVAQSRADNELERENSEDGTSSNRSVGTMNLISGRSGFDEAESRHVARTLTGQIEERENLRDSQNIVEIENFADSQIHGHSENELDTSEFIDWTLLPEVQRIAMMGLGTRQVNLFANADHCHFVVSREHITGDTMQLLEAYSERILKKPVKVMFTNERGVDEGGLKSELFQILVKDIMTEKFGMFNTNKESNFSYFSRSWNSESETDFTSCGTIVGLALYNNVSVDVNLPRAFYKYMMGKEMTVEDFKDFDPVLYKGLENLLKFEGDVEATFCRTFSVSYDHYGKKVTEDLIENGNKKVVNNKNRELFVDLYAKWFLVNSVSRQLGAFKSGFDKICRCSEQWVLDLFEPEELQLVLCGTSDLDINQWKDSTTLTGYKWSDAIVKNFWKLLLSFNEEEKKNFLHFVTGCVRAPIGGLKELPLRIIKGDSTDNLPTSRTCFNHFVLPPYESRSKLRKMMSLALENCEGFGLE